MNRAHREQISREQLELMLVGLSAVLEKPVAEVPTPKPAAPAHSRHPRRAVDDQHLPTREAVIEPVEVSADPQGWTRLGEERTSQPDFKPGKLFRHVIVRPRYVRREQFATESTVGRAQVSAGRLCLNGLGGFSERDGWGQ
jgi:hypothetical protein